MLYKAAVLHHGRIRVLKQGVHAQTVLCDHKSSVHQETLKARQCSLGVAAGVGAQLLAEINVALRDARNCPGIHDVETLGNKNPSNCEAVAMTLVGTLHVDFLGPNCWAMDFKLLRATSK